MERHMSGNPELWVDRPKEAHNSTHWMGEWDVWVEVYDQLPVVTRAALAHLHGQHDELTMHCPLCLDPGELVAAVKQLDGVEQRVTESANVSGVELRILQVTEPGTYLIVPVSASEEPTESK
jgi:hypothetical protein